MDQGRAFDELIMNMIITVDRSGEVLGKGGNPFSSWLEMTKTIEGLTIHFRVQNSPHSNGSAWIKVTETDKTLLEASGNFTVACYNMKATTYTPGDWEKKIPVMPDQTKRR
ncbi:MAG: hypothetical protein Q7R79_03610 [bacterium]|nr:hypothetical protein [bacterium]